jgi:tetratricopeptide (TPR) repeat protein
MIRHLIFSGIFNRHSWFIGLLVLLTMTVYANALPGDWSIVDDLPGIVNSQRYEDLGENIRSGHIQNVIFSVMVYVFGYNPLPFHIFSLCLHLVNVILGFVLLYWLLGEKVAKIGSLIFAVHPVNTEAVTWISGSPYLINGIFFLPSMIAYVWFKRSGLRKYLWWSLAWFTAVLALTRTPSVLTLPIALVVIDQLILEKRINWRSLVNFGWYLIPIVIYIMAYLRGAMAGRLTSRESGSYLNEQTMSPILESWPYTISKMLELYVWPRKLMIYYDGGNFVRFGTAYWIMAGVTILYIGLVIYLLLGKRWERVGRHRSGEREGAGQETPLRRMATGLMLLPVVLLAPTMSPIKVTWFMAERYMYLGSLFYGGIAGTILIGIMNYESRIKNLRILVWGILSLIILALSARTVFRNMDYLDNKQFARVTIEDAPLSVRPYNDLGSLYLMDGEAEEAVRWYRKALELNALSRTSIHNIGLIYIRAGEVDYMAPSFNLPEGSDAENLLAKARWAVANKVFTNAAYYLGEPDNAEAFSLVGDVFVSFEAWPVARKYYLMSVELDDQQAEVFNKLTFVVAKMGDLVSAKEYAEKVLELNPEHEGARKNLEILEERLGS